MKKPKAKIGRAAEAIENEKPKKATIQAVTVVPMFAPKITPIAWLNVRISAFTKLTTITVVAPEDWMIAVTHIPQRRAVKRLPVIFFSNCCKEFPAPF